MRLVIFATLFLTACGEPIRVNAPPPPEDWLVCRELPARPNLEPLERITLSDGRIVYLAQQTNARDAQIARWIVEAQNVHFECWNNAAKVRQYYKDTK
jgi:hypothetical protein